MTEDEKLVLNEKIALLLGFEKLEYLGAHQWVYPKEFQYMQSQVPEWYCPDFLHILENHRKIKEITFGNPKVYV